MLDLLKGVRVVSFNHFLLGPMGIQTLGDLGADVIAVEATEGAWQRHWSGGDIWHDGQSVLHLCANRNKRNVALDLKSREGARDRAQAGRHRRRGGGELSPGRDGKARLRLRGAQGAQALADLCIRLRLRPRRALCRATRAGPALAGAVRPDGDHRAPRRRPAPGRRLGDRPPRRGAVRHGHPGGAAAPRAHRPGLPGRRQPDAGDARPAGGVAGRLAQRVAKTRRDQRAPPRRRLALRRALRRLCDPGRPPGGFALSAGAACRSHRRAAARRLLGQGCFRAAGRDQRADRWRARKTRPTRRMDRPHGAGQGVARARAGLSRRSSRTRRSGTCRRW